MIEHICLIFFLHKTKKNTETLQSNRYITSCFELWFKGKGFRRGIVLWSFSLLHNWPFKKAT